MRSGVTFRGDFALDDPSGMSPPRSTELGQWIVTKLRARGLEARLDDEGSPDYAVRVECIVDGVPLDGLFGPFGQPGAFIGALDESRGLLSRIFRHGNPEALERLLRGLDAVLHSDAR